MRWLNSVNEAMNMDLGKLQKLVENRVAWYAAAHGITQQLKIDMEDCRASGWHFSSNLGCCIIKLVSMCLPDK